MILERLSLASGSSFGCCLVLGFLALVLYKGLASWFGHGMSIRQHRLVRKLRDATHEERYHICTVFIWSLFGCWVLMPSSLYLFTL